MRPEATGEAPEWPSFSGFVQAVALAVGLLGMEAAGGGVRAAAAQNGGLTVESILGFSEGFGEEMTIESESLEIRRLADNGRILVFQKGVFVKQSELQLYADELSAFYGPKDSEPERLEARGHVRVVLRDQRAWCEEADFDREQDQIVCRIEARLERGCDTVWGEKIVLDLTEERARVLGGARVQIEAEENGADCISGSERSEPLR